MPKLRQRMSRVVAAVGAIAALSCGLSGCTRTVAAHYVEREIDELVRQVTGHSADVVSCPDDLPAKVGSWIRCSFTAQGATFGVTATVTSIQDGTANFELTVDDQPQL